MHKFTLASAALLVGLTISLSAQAALIVPVPDYPGATTTSANAINNNDVITGYYIDVEGAQHGFVGTLDGNYTSFDFPGGRTFPEGINDENFIVGDANIQNEDCQVQGCQYARLPDGTIKGITKNDAPLDGFAQQVTNRRKYVGQYWVIDEESQTLFGFVGKGTKYKSDITLPFNTLRTEPRGINKANEMVGFYRDLDTHNAPGFIIRHGVVSAVQYPDANAFFTFLESINDKSSIVGGWANSDTTVEQPFIYNQSDNTYTLIDIPGATTALAHSINNAGAVVVNSDIGTFLYCKRRSACPSTGGAIEIRERVVRGKPLHWAVCKGGCLMPSKATARPTAAMLREAMRKDPSLAVELRTKIRP